MGHIIRLNTVFSNKNLPAIVDRDTESLESIILNHPNLQGFWDFSDLRTLTLVGSSITKVTDKSKNKISLVAPADTAPELDSLTLKNMASGYFNGNKFMTSEDIVFKNNWKENTIVIFAQKPIVTQNPEITILVSRKKTSSYVVYVDNRSIALNAGRARIIGDNVITGKPLNIIASTVFETNESHLRTPNAYNANARPALTAADDHVFVGRWWDDYDAKTASNWNGYIGHVMIFDKNLEKEPIFMDLLLEYSRRKYGTPLWDK
ncbi:hypothetical protein LQU74_02945 [Actinobacillus pleuropneumoniae]|uniref:hypothetical protein n=1 Tax=Actinobacillus pleuropneumoniae TaxID=715 RepID=UPI00202031ED|nr:hypothetical protein [Actinobacillus pleuropneumoniae]MCL7711497.1 hypothetical protein [Actinobacillus pleuropneumoniae]MCL7741926.1 hypothetical protein [Actinobacillus pleuropneumoniae]